jgi:cellulose synthase/poly-beta-1,6-N-acetylglucosamine synthase-like glycosyltransferase
MIATILFLAAVSAVWYVLIGYPLLLAMLARFFAKPVAKAEHFEPVSVIIPVRNGEQWLRRKIESVLAQDYPADLREIIIVSDGSTDSTEAIAIEYAQQGVRLLSVAGGGKPAALNAAVPVAQGRLLFLTDVRQVLRPDCLRRLVACMADPAVGVVSGNLQISTGATEEEHNTGLYWRYENWIRRNLARIHSMLGATGPVCLVRRSLYVPIPTDSLLDDVYLPLSIHLKGYRLVLEEDAIAIDEPTKLSSEFRRKVRTQAGIVQLIGTFPGLFSSRNRMRFHFVSLKLGRLLLPYMLLTMLGASLALPMPWRWLAVIPQMIFWSLAVADPWFTYGSLIKKLTSIPRAFAVLVLSAACALQILFVPPRKLWIETRPRAAAEKPNG